MSKDLTSLLTQGPACDCHVHVFDPDRFAFAADRAYTPGRASLKALQSLHDGLGVQRVVFVQPSVYGIDNACLVDAVATLGQQRARGVAVVNLHEVSEQELHSLHAAGVRAVRLNLEVSEAGLDQARCEVKAARRLSRMPGWHVQVHAKLPVVAALIDDFAALEMPTVLDHYAGASGEPTEIQATLDRLLSAMQRLPLYVKLSAAYRLADGSDPEELARQFYQAAPSQVVWGSDWPHTGGSGGKGRDPSRIEPFREIDNDQALQRVVSALGDTQAARRVLIDNPAHLYGF